MKMHIFIYFIFGNKIISKLMMKLKNLKINAIQ